MGSSVELHWHWHMSSMRGFFLLRPSRRTRDDSVSDGLILSTVTTYLLKSVTDGTTLHTVISVQFFRPAPG